MTSHEFEAFVLADGYNSVLTIKRPIGYSLGDHQHAFDACALITAGEITLVVNGVSRTYARGEIFRLPAGTPHLESSGPDGVSFLSARRDLL